MRFLASFQDPEMATLKNATVFPDLPSNSVSRGRDNYSRYGVLRTKPGRADSPPTLSMSCSDKMAAWNVTGLQGALASKIFKPIYLSALVIGEVDDSLRQTVRQDCERALWSRLHGVTGEFNDDSCFLRVTNYDRVQIYRMIIMSTDRRYISRLFPSSIHGYHLPLATLVMNVNG